MSAESLPDVRFRPETDGSSKAEMCIGEQSASRCWIIPFTLRIGDATVRMEGIGGVGTEDEFRNKGYSRHVLEATVEWMKGRDAALSMLYGIPNYYPKFGYATAGPDYFITLFRLKRKVELAPGWRVRPFELKDFPAVHRLYDLNTSKGVGAAVRQEDSRIWSKLATTEDPANPDSCRVVENPEGSVVAYAWKGKGFWYVGQVEKESPNALVLAEIFADGPASADAVLTACRLWAREETSERPEPYEEVIFAAPPEGPIYDAALYQHTSTKQNYSACGGSMARVLHVGKLLESLKPELHRRVKSSGLDFNGTLAIQTEIGGASLQVTPIEIAVHQEEESPESRSVGGGESVVVSLPQSELARLALGAFPPKDLLERLEISTDSRASEILQALFPQRHPHMYLPDRF